MCARAKVLKSFLLLASRGKNETAETARRTREKVARREEKEKVTHSTSQTADCVI